MYADQHTIESMGTARLLAANAYAYEDYLSRIFGRRWVLAGPAKIKGPARLRVKFAPDKVATGDGNGPFIILWVEFNPAMGLHTVWGEYWGKEDATEPEYKSSPRSGYDNEMLADPARIFDWLDVSVTMGESKQISIEAVAEALGGMVTPAGNFIDTDVISGHDGVLSLQLEPEMRMPKEYFVSGTRFPGMTGPDETDYGSEDHSDEWFDSYVEPVQSAVQMTLDTLYGVGMFKVEVDLNGYVVVSKQPIPPQNFGSWASDNLPKDTNLMPMESKKTWYEDAVLRMAGVGNHERLADRKLAEAWYDSGTVIDLNKDKKSKKQPPLKFGKVKDKDNMAAFDQLVSRLKAQKKAGADIRDPEALAGWIGLRMAGKKGAAARKSKTPEENTETESESLSDLTERMRALLNK